MPRPTPRAALAALAMLPVIALVPRWWTLLACAIAVIALIIVDGLLAAPPRSISLARDLPRQVRLPGSIEGRLLLASGRRRARLVVRDVWNPTAGIAVPRTAVSIPRGERRAITQAFRPSRRGEHACRGVAVDSRGPLGLGLRTATLEAPGRFTALHPMRSLRHLPSRVRRLREIEGTSSLHQRGEGTEFDSLKEFVDGDDAASIDWRATARTRSVVVRTWRPERDRRVLIIVDTSRLAAARLGDEPRLDAELDAAGLLTALAAEAGDRVDIVCADARIRSEVVGVSRSTVLTELVARTASLQPRLVETDWAALAARATAATSRGDLVVVLTSIEPALLHAGGIAAIAQIASTHPVIVGSAEDPGLAALASERGTAHAVHRAASAHRLLAQQAGLAEEIRRSGASVVAARPEELPTGVADQYLALKAAGRL